MASEEHGGNIYKASDKFGIEKFNILDYSANLNPLGIPDLLRDIFISNIQNTENYPDPECTALKDAISSYVGVNTDHIIIGNGATEVIRLLFSVLLPKRLLIPVPTFSEYQRFAEAFKCKVDFFNLKEQENFKPNMKEFIEMLTVGVDTVMLCNPNNPTSTLVSRADLEELLKCALTKGITVIVDEAFIELTDGGNNNSVSDLLASYDNLFIIRAFTKVFAIPGVRLGYGLGNIKIIKRMWELKIPWSVNTFACLVADFLPQAEGYLSKTREWLTNEKEYFYNQLLGIDGLKVYRPQTNFILIKIIGSDLTSDRLKDKMASKGILIRDASNFMFLNNRFVRVAIKDRESNERFLEVITNIMKRGETDMEILNKTINSIKPAYGDSVSQARERLDILAKPIGSLGKLEDIAAKLAGITGKVHNKINKKGVIVMCADNGVVDEGVSAAPQSITALLTENMAKGIMGVCVLSGQAGADVKVVDIGVNAKFNNPKIIDRKIAFGTHNISKEPAMTRIDAIKAIEIGIEIVDKLVEEGYDLLGTGELGIGNTTTSAAVLSALSGLSPDITVGMGVGLTKEQFENKKRVVSRALEVNMPDKNDVLDVIAKVGGLDIAGLCGCFLGAAKNRIPIVIDGYISSAAALCAYKLNPLLHDFMFPSHLSAEQGASYMMKELGLEPLLDLKMRLGEGSGCPFAFYIIESALAIINHMGTFDDAMINNDFLVDIR